MVGHNGNVLQTMEIDQEPITGYMGLDRLTHPNYRRQGIAGTLSRNKREELKKSGITLTIGVPNRIAAKASQSQGRLWISKYQILVRIFNWDNTLKSKFRNTVIRKLGAFGGTSLQNLLYRVIVPRTRESLRIAEVESFDERVDSLWDRVSDQHRIMTMRKKDTKLGERTKSQVNFPSIRLFIASVSPEVVAAIVQST